MLSSDKNIETIAAFVEELKKWLQLKSDYTRLTFVDMIIRITTGLVIGIVLLSLILLFLTYLTFAAAIFLGEVLGNIAWGYLIVSVIYLFLIVIFYSGRHLLIERPLVRFLVSILADNLNDDSADEYVEHTSRKEGRL